MKVRIATVLMLAALVVAGAWAQDVPGTQSVTGAQGPRRHAGFRARRFGIGRALGQLNLTEDQKTRMHTLMQTEHQQALAIHQDTTLTPEQQREKAKQIHQDAREQLQGILTPEQQSQLAAFRAAGPQMGGMGVPLGRLNLTEQQKSQMKPIFEAAHQRMQTLRSDTSLTPEQKREQLKQLRQETHAQMAAILTPEQQQQLQQWQHHRRQGNGPPSGGAQPQS